MRKPRAADVRLEGRTGLHEYDHRIRLLLMIFLIPLCLLGGRLWFLQILRGNEYHQAAVENTVRERTLAAFRGTIFDARGRVLAENRPSYDVYVTPDAFGEDAEAMDVLRTHLALSDDEVARLRGAILRQEQRELRLRRDITRNQVAALETFHLELPGVSVDVASQRHYPYDDLAVHLLGYMGEASPDRLVELEAEGYIEGDYIGHVALEQALEPLLRGQNGLERFVVNAAGRVLEDEVSTWALGGYERVDPIAGRNVVLTVDVELQEIVQNAMRDYETGAVVAVDPRDGSLLAMVSKPSYNPNAWTGRLSPMELARDSTDAATPLYDRAIHAYFPGSTFKIVTAAAALEEGLIGPDDTLHCDGQYTYGNRVFNCNQRHGHGDVGLAEALQQSCNVYFYKLGERLGIERLVEYSRLFGFTERPGSGLPNESPGLVPTHEWLEEHSPEGFQYGQVLNVSVGQGDTRTSPLQLAMAYAAIANGGTLFYPRLLDRIETAERSVLFEYPNRVRRDLPFRESHLGEILLGLTMAVNAPGGTAYESRLDYTIVAGKTGTAQGTQIDTPSDGAEPDTVAEEQTSAWFAGFAPVDDPQIVVVVFLEHGGSGGRNAAPVGVEIIDAYFREILDYDVEIQAAVASGHSDELEGLMRLNVPGSENEALRSPEWAERYLFGHIPDRPTQFLRAWRDR